MSALERSFPLGRPFRKTEVRVQLGHPFHLVLLVPLTIAPSVLTFLLLIFLNIDSSPFLLLCASGIAM